MEIQTCQSYFFCSVCQLAAPTTVKQIGKRPVRWAGPAFIMLLYYILDGYQSDCSSEENPSVFPDMLAHNMLDYSLSLLIPVTTVMDCELNLHSVYNTGKKWRLVQSVFLTHPYLCSCRRKPVLKTMTRLAALICGLTDAFRNHFLQYLALITCDIGLLKTCLNTEPPVQWI